MTSITDQIPAQEAPSQHLNQYQLSKRWNVSQSTLERWRFLRRGPKFLKIGARVVYRLSDIEAYEADNIRQGTNASEICQSGPQRQPR